LLKLVFIDFLETAAMANPSDLADYWRGHVEAWRDSGLSQREYCTQHALKSHRLSYWVRRLARAPRTLTFVPMAADIAAAEARLEALPSLKMAESYVVEGKSIYHG
jgi:hypothetical protein